MTDDASVGRRRRPRVSAVAALSVLGIIVGITADTLGVATFFNVGPGGRTPVPDKVSEIDSSRSPQEVEPTQPAEAATPTSERPTEQLSQGTLVLPESSSEVIGGLPLRIATEYILSSFAPVRASSDTITCAHSLAVGESLVLSNRQTGAEDYSEWYRVILTGIEDDRAEFEWLSGTGAAPVDSAEESCL